MFYPYTVLSPDTSYTLTAEVLIENCLFTVSSTFSTASVPLPTLWLEVALGDVQRVYVHEGETVLRTFPCSGGTEETPSLLGCYHLQERGEQFYSARWQEGARYWIRIQNQFLFHSIPRRKDGTVIQEEADKIGLPASHGCIRLRDEDALWLYQNVPDGTMVILRPGPALP